MGKRRARSPSPDSDSATSSGEDADLELDAKQTCIVDKARDAMRKEATNVSPAQDGPLLTSHTPKPPNRATTPEPKDDPENSGENYEVRRLLRNPRYFDDDFELAALRCFRCGGGGHREAECSRPPKLKPCHLCGEGDHLSRDCPHGLCFNCLQPGHRSRDCEETRGIGRQTQSLRCLRCGGANHSVMNCAENFSDKDLQRISCYVCGKLGHLCCAPQDSAAESLKSSKGKSCCRCGGAGHVDSECAHGIRRGGGYQGGSNAHGQNQNSSQNVFQCFKCGKTGHIARECPSAPAEQEMDSRGTLSNTSADGAGGPMRSNGGGSKYGGYGNNNNGGGFRGGGNINTKGGWATGGGGGGRGGWSGKGGRCRGRGSWSGQGKPRSGPY